MTNSLEFRRRFRILSGLSGIIGVVLPIASFAINNGPPPGATYQELVKFAQQNYAQVLWGAWLQAVGPILIVIFAFALVHLAGATQRLAGWMTFFGATILMIVSLMEVTFYSTLFLRAPGHSRDCLGIWPWCSQLLLRY